jgi:hypothetical protein
MEMKPTDVCTVRGILLFTTLNMLKSLVFALLKVFLVQNPGATAMVTVEQCDNLSRSIIEKLITYNNILRGNLALGFASCKGRNERLDVIHFAEDCHPETWDIMRPYHRAYDCVSLDGGIEFLRIFIIEMLEAPERVELVPDSTFFHAFHLMNDHLVDKAYEAAGVLPSLAQDDIDLFHVLISAVSFAGIAPLLAGFAIFMFTSARSTQTSTALCSSSGVCRHCQLLRTQNCSATC